MGDKSSAQLNSAGPESLSCCSSHLAFSHQGHWGGTEEVRGDGEERDHVSPCRQCGVFSSYSSAALKGGTAAALRGHTPSRVCRARHGQAGACTCPQLGLQQFPVETARQTYKEQPNYRSGPFTASVQWHFLQGWECSGFCCPLGQPLAYRPHLECD